jgi:hypothetical protein
MVVTYFVLYVLDDNLPQLYCSLQRQQHAQYDHICGQYENFSNLKLFNVRHFLGKR